MKKKLSEMSAEEYINTPNDELIRMGEEDPEDLEKAMKKTQKEFDEYVMWAAAHTEPHVFVQRDGTKIPVIGETDPRDPRMKAVRRRRRRSAR